MKFEASVSVQELKVEICHQKLMTKKMASISIQELNVDDIKAKSKQLTIHIHQSSINYQLYEVVWIENSIRHTRGWVAA